MAYIANMPDGQLPAWLSANRLMLWTLLALSELGGRAHLDVLYRRLGQLLRIPEDLLWLEHPTGALGPCHQPQNRVSVASESPPLVCAATGINKESVGGSN